MGLPPIDAIPNDTQDAIEGGETSDGGSVDASDVATRDAQVVNAETGAPDVSSDAMPDVSSDVPDARSDAGTAPTCETRRRGTTLLPAMARTQQLTIGGDFGCGIMGLNREVRCWGEVYNGRRGNGAGTVMELGGAVLVDVGSPIGPVEELTLGTRHACARGTTGDTYCWGDDDLGQRSGWMRSAYRDVTLMAEATHGLSAGEAHTCAVLDGGSDRVQCWGSNAQAELGLPAGGSTRVNRLDPFEPGVEVCDVTAGGHFNCALLANGHVWCWGANDSRQLGTATGTTPQATPVRVALPELADVFAVHAGHEFACVLGASATNRDITSGVFCWGRNSNRQLGPLAGGGESSGVATQVYGAGPAMGRTAVVSDFVLAGQTGCMRFSDTSVVACWGSNGSQLLGQVGRSLTASSDIPLPISLAEAPGVTGFEVVMQASSQASALCAIATTGEVICWGTAGSRQLARRGAVVVPTGTPPGAPGVATLLP